jgi:hypothetical protein
VGCFGIPLRNSVSIVMAWDFVVLVFGLFHHVYLSDMDWIIYDVALLCFLFLGILGLNKNKPFLIDAYAVSLIFPLMVNFHEIYEIIEHEHSSELFPTILAISFFGQLFRVYCIYMVYSLSMRIRNGDLSVLENSQMYAFVVPQQPLLARHPQEMTAPTSNLVNQQRV